MRIGHDANRLIGPQGKTRPRWQRRCGGPSTTNKRLCAACGSLSHRPNVVPVALARERSAGG
jgi:rRNA maturation endonuclease Nob1